LLSTKGVYVADITVGETRVLRGHWADRLADIDADIAAIAAKLAGEAGFGEAGVGEAGIKTPADTGVPIARAIAEARSVAAAVRRRTTCATRDIPCRPGVADGVCVGHQYDPRGSTTASSTTPSGGRAPPCSQRSVVAR
jgi:hypothetical protein